MGIIPSLSQLVMLWAKNVVGHLCCQGILLAHIQFTVYQKDLLIFFRQAASSVSQASACVIVPPSHGHDFAFVLVEFHKVPLSLFLELV